MAEERELTPRQRRFAEEYAVRLNKTQAAIAAGYSERTAYAEGNKVMKLPHVRAYVETLLSDQREELRKTGIANKDARIGLLQDKVDRLMTVIAERAADPDMANVPGGTTGLIVRQFKVVAGDALNEYSVDTATVKELRETLKQAAIEIGDWAEKKEVTGADGGPLSLTIIDLIRMAGDAEEATP